MKPHDNEHDDCILLNYLCCIFWVLCTVQFYCELYLSLNVFISMSHRHAYVVRNLIVGNLRFFL